MRYNPLVKEVAIMVGQSLLTAALAHCQDICNEEDPEKIIGTFHVLIVEDDAMQQYCLQEIFQVANLSSRNVQFVTSFASSSAEAMVKLSMFVFDLVLLDIMLPGASGEDILEDIRALLGDTVAIVMVSCHAQEETVQHCMLLGADGYLQKPITLKNVKLIWQYCYKALRPVRTDQTTMRSTGSEPIPIPGSGDSSPPHSPVGSPPRSCSPMDSPPGALLCAVPRQSISKSPPMVIEGLSSRPPSISRRAAPPLHEALDNVRMAAPEVPAKPRHLSRIEQVAGQLACEKLSQGEMRSRKVGIPL